MEPHSGRESASVSGKGRARCRFETKNCRNLSSRARGAYAKMTEKLEQLHRTLEEARKEVAKVVLGQQEVVDRALIVILARQHGLIEGVPGIAKTLLVRTLARVLGCDFARIQFTPDLMPADITGTNIFQMQRNEFSLIKGPI